MKRSVTGQVNVSVESPGWHGPCTCPGSIRFWPYIDCGAEQVTSVDLHPIELGPGRCGRRMMLLQRMNLFPFVSAELRKQHKTFPVETPQRVHPPIKRFCASFSRPELVGNLKLFGDPRQAVVRMITLEVLEIFNRLSVISDRCKSVT